VLACFKRGGFSLSFCEDDDEDETDLS